MAEVHTRNEDYSVYERCQSSFEVVSSEAGYPVHLEAIRTLLPPLPSLGEQQLHCREKVREKVYETRGVAKKGCESIQFVAMSGANSS